jgi:hypothetical protein
LIFRNLFACFFLLVNYFDIVSTINISDFRTCYVSLKIKSELVWLDDVRYFVMSDHSEHFSSDYSSGQYKQTHITQFFQKTQSHSPSFTFLFLILSYPLKIKDEIYLMMILKPYLLFCSTFFSVLISLFSSYSLFSLSTKTNSTIRKNYKIIRNFK